MGDESRLASSSSAKVLDEESNLMSGKNYEPGFINTLPKYLDDKSKKNLALTSRFGRHIANLEPYSKTKKITSLYSLEDFIHTFSETYPNTPEFNVLDLELTLKNPNDVDEFFEKLFDAQSFAKEVHLRANLRRSSINSFMQKLNGSSITSLNLGYNETGVEGAKAIADAIKNPNSKITSLNLCSNQIGVEGAKAIADALEDLNCKVAKIDCDSVCQDILYNAIKTREANKLKPATTIEPEGVVKTQTDSSIAK